MSNTVVTTLLNCVFDDRAMSSAQDNRQDIPESPVPLGRSAEIHGEQGEPKQMTVERLQQILEHYLANGVLTKESLISFADIDAVRRCLRHDKSKFTSYPIDGERLAYVGSVPDHPAMFVMTNMTAKSFDDLTEPV
jgi:hypothetical protein